MSNNALEALPKSLATLPSLKKISAAHNRLSQPGLPDLSSLSHLHELRLNDNRPLSSLPPHFGSWGKADPPAPSSSVSGRDASAKPRRGGLEILDLGNCGFESWFGLRELAKQDGIVNLGLKGNKVAEEAIATSGFENFREKVRPDRGGSPNLRDSRKLTARCPGPSHRRRIRPSRSSRSSSPRFASSTRTASTRSTPN